ncbi:interferon alpha-inducible protein 27-like protein 2A [Parasteatoda tepidariorum]|uniref:interferon alpha-inducible protein 27-like protein 2A n=1 Tax=Parasteatoda tepidariorum TaxID=114398 RepID=UPI00077F93C4|nr:interferon alpha-inducible protein 27-like protein 2A [Parasteatoda tepidariorum]
MRFKFLSILWVLQIFVLAEAVPDKDKNQKESKINWKEYGWFALKTAGASAAVIGGTAVVVPALGFTAGGVAAGSVAAWIQSTFLGGTIASGGIFAGMQSIGAAGLAASTKAAIGAASAVVAGVTKNDSPVDTDSSEKSNDSEK